MPIQVESSSGTVGCSPRIREKQEPTISLVLTMGREAMPAELHPMEAKRLGEALVADAEAVMQMPLSVPRKPREEEED